MKRRFRDAQVVEEAPEGALPSWKEAWSWECRRLKGWFEVSRKMTATVWRRDIDYNGLGLEIVHKAIGVLAPNTKN